MTDQPVVVVTGGGGGIGAAVAEELGRTGWYVVTVDPLVTLDGSEALPTPEETTAGRIVAAGGSARASATSVTDADAVRTLFEELVAEHGRLDAVVNVAGISRPTSFAAGTEEDWRSVLEVHLDGYLNVLRAALPLMAAARRGRILGVTSGSGWRPADAGAYSCAKRAVAALTWELGRHAPPGVVVNAISPIAVTRMVTEALARAQAAHPSPGGSTAASGGLSLGSMPQPADLGPLAAHLIDDAFDWCSGQVVFAGGSEVALVEPPALLEVVHSDTSASLPHLLEAVVPGAFAKAEERQVSGGGGNPRFDAAFVAVDGELAGPDVRTCAVVTHHPLLGQEISEALEARGVRCDVQWGPSDPATFEGAAARLGGAAERLGSLDAVVVALTNQPRVRGATPWEVVLAEHAGAVSSIHGDAAWVRAVTERASEMGTPLRIVTVTDARLSDGRTRAQVMAQLARASRRATGELVTAFAVSMEGDEIASSPTVGALAAHLVCHPEAGALSGAELAVGDGWLALRSHPRPGASLSLGGADLPPWFDDALREVVGAPESG